jgi:hypothetical protein
MKIISKILFICALLFSGLSFAANHEVKMTADLSGGQTVPPVQTAGKGAATVMFNKDNNELSWTVTYSGLSGPATMAHFHGPAAVGANAGVVVPFQGNVESPIKGKATITAAQAKDLLAGMWYINVHTQKNPGGEIRGQVTVAK